MKIRYYYFLFLKNNLEVLISFAEKVARAFEKNGIYSFGIYAIYITS